MSFDAAWNEETYSHLEPSDEAATVDTRIGSDKQWRTTLSRLASLEFLKQGWDGEDASVINPQILESVNFLLQYLRDNQGDPPDKIVPTFEGGVVLEWRTSFEYMELEVEEPYCGEVMKIREGEEASHDLWRWRQLASKTPDTLLVWPEYGDYFVVEPDEFQTASGLG